MNEELALRPGSFETLAKLLRAGSGLMIGPDKLYLLNARLRPLAQRHGIATLDELADRVRHRDSGELQREVIEAMTTNESFFFRDEKPFIHVRDAALPRLHAARPAGHRLRIWSAAASAGQEAYSLAMIVAELRGTLGTRTVEIVGTDIAREQIARAVSGTYSAFEVQRGLPSRVLARHFVRHLASWKVSSALRDMVSFREWNLLSDLRPLGQFDIVFCRNVLIYFDLATKGRVLAAIAGQLAPDGLLYLGGAETILGITDQFSPHGAERGVYELASVPRALAAAWARPPGASAAAAISSHRPAPSPARDIRHDQP